MKHILWFIVLICPFAFGGCPSGQARDERALVQLEQSWAQALERQDSDAVGCILAEELQEVDLGGMLRDCAENLASVIKRQPAHYELSEMQPHVYGESGYVRGLSTVTDSAGNIRSRVRFTDIFVCRKDHWLAVAGQESLVKETSK